VKGRPIDVHFSALGGGLALAAFAVIAQHFVHENGKLLAGSLSPYPSLVPPVLLAGSVVIQQLVLKSFD